VLSFLNFQLKASFFSFTCSNFF